MNVRIPVGTASGLTAFACYGTKPQVTERLSRQQLGSLYCRESNEISTYLYSASAVGQLIGNHKSELSWEAFPNPLGGFLNRPTVGVHLEREGANQAPSHSIVGAALRLVFRTRRIFRPSSSDAHQRCQLIPLASYGNM